MPIEIEVHGQRREKRKILHYAEAIMAHYFGNRVKRYVDIDIYFVKNLDGTEGFCHGDGDHIIIEIAKGGNYEKYEYDRMMKTLAHELTHAKQYIRGEIRGDDTLWRAKGIILDCEHLPYEEQPWEIEAFNAEEFMYTTYWR